MSATERKSSIVCPDRYVNKRERNKEDRRKHIILAAKAMIYQDNFSMRNLADAAGISVVTTYALFGSREKVLAAVLEMDLVEFSAELDARGGDPIDGLFAILDVVRERFEREPDYFRSMIKSISNGENDVGDQFVIPRMGTWRQLMEAALKDRLLKRGVNTDTLAKAMIHFTVGLFREWAQERISADRVRAEGCYILAILLRPVSSPKITARLDQHRDFFLAQIKAVATGSAKEIRAPA